VELGGEVDFESNSFVFSFPHYEDRKSLMLELQAATVQCDYSVLPSLV
jgi:hypothetical protein